MSTTAAKPAAARDDLFASRPYWLVVAVVAIVVTALLAMVGGFAPADFESRKAWAGATIILFALVSGATIGVTWFAVVARTAWPIIRREFLSLFYSPIAYVVIGLFALGATALFLGSFGPGTMAAMSGTYRDIVFLLAFLTPAVSMRLISEELRSNTIETLVTSPVSDVQIVIGKWLGALGFMACLVGALVVHIILLEVHSNPDLGPILTGLVGLLFVCGLYLAIGAFASACTQNQIIAFIVALSVNVVISFVMAQLPRAQFVGNNARQVMYYLNINRQFESFSNGVLDLMNFVYFFSGTALFLFLAVKMIESRKWR